MAEVVPRIFLANVKYAVENAERFSLAVNCTPDTINTPATLLVITIPVRDNGNDAEQDAMLALLPDALAQGHTHVTAGRPVLVFCRAGQQRSAAFVACYLIRYHGLSSHAAVQHVRDRKRDAFLGAVNFARCITAFAEIIHDRDR